MGISFIGADRSPDFPSDTRSEDQLTSEQIEKDLEAHFCDFRIARSNNGDAEETGVQDVEDVLRAKTLGHDHFLLFMATPSSFLASSSAFSVGRLSCSTGRGSLRGSCGTGLGSFSMGCLVSIGRDFSLIMFRTAQAVVSKADFGAFLPILSRRCSNSSSACIKR